MVLTSCVGENNAPCMCVLQILKSTQDTQGETCKLRLYKCVGRGKIEHDNEIGMTTWVSIIDKFLKVGANLRKQSNLRVHLGYLRATHAG